MQALIGSVARSGPGDFARRKVEQRVTTRSFSDGKRSSTQNLRAGKGPEVECGTYGIS